MLPIISNAYGTTPSTITLHLNVADKIIWNAPEVADSDDMEIDDDCMETNYALQKLCRHAKEDTEDMWREKVTKYETNSMDRGAAKRKTGDKTDEKK